MDICFWNKCNNRCLMCTNPNDFWESNIYTEEFLKKRLAQLADRDQEGDSILLTGGEPTIHPKFLEVLRFISREYPDRRIDLLTNGRRFVYEDFAREVMRVPNLMVAIPLHGCDAKTHEKITRSPGSFEQAKKGIANILKFRQNYSGQILEIRTVISRLNYRQTGKILKMIADEFPSADRAVVIFLEVEGQAADNFKTVGLKYADYQPYFKNLEPFVDKFREFRLYHFPLCVLPQKLWPYAWRTLPLHEVAYLPTCRDCRYQDVCLGVHKGYLAQVGSKEFKAIKKEVKIKKTGNFYHPLA